MKNQWQKHDQTIDHLKEKYKISAKELKLLEKIKRQNIHSISFTAEGGFHNKTGEYFSEVREDCFKIQIKYEDLRSADLKVIYLVPAKVYVI